jgi:hypothetical protein
MENVQSEIKSGKLLITVDLSKSGAPSKSGKSVIIGSTHGNIQVAPGVVLSLNVYKPAQ